MNNTEQPKSHENEFSRGRILAGILTISVSLISGGAMGSIITHYYATRQTTVRYLLNTTSLGAGAEMKNLLPTLKLQLNNVDIPTVYTHTFELTHASGPELERASVSITFTGAEVLGSPLAYGPDPVHKISCAHDAPTHSIICSLGRLSSNNGNSYKVIVATDQAPHIINIAIDGKDTIIERATNRERDDISMSDLLRHIGTISLGAALGTMLCLFASAFYRMRHLH